MLECDICHKVFKYKIYLERHKNNKVPCDAVKESTECKLCNITFPCLAKLKTHKESKKHINNHNIQIANTINNNIDMSTNITNNIHVTLMRGFSETNIDVITSEDIDNLLRYEFELFEFIKIYKKADGEEIDHDTDFVCCIFKFLIKIFSKLNFNLAYSENHNCLIFSFSKSNTEFIEYQLLEIDNTNKKYYKRSIKFENFIEEFLNLMKKVNKKFNNKTLDYILFYVTTFKKFLFRKFSQSKHTIETELLSSYNEFELSKNKVKTEEEEFQLALTTFRNNAFKHILN